MPIPIRVGAVAYLNAKPLIERLTDFAPNIELSLDLPSRLAEQLAGQDLTALRSSLSGAAPVIRNFSSDSATSIERR